MHKELLLFIKYPYTAGVIITIWIGSAALLAINKDLPMITIVVLNMVTSVFLATVGFSGNKEI